MKKLSLKEHQEQQREKGIMVLRDPENTHSEEMARRKKAYHDYQDTMPKLIKQSFLMTGKYIPAGQYKNIPQGNR